MNGSERKRSLTVLAQDPSVKKGSRLLRTTVHLRHEELKPGAEGHRVRIIDYDATTQTLYQPNPISDVDAYASASDDQLLEDPGFHWQNTYALVMATLCRFEYALGRRVGWSVNGHQLKSLTQSNFLGSPSTSLAP